MSTKVLPCNCQHEYQDKKYGKGQRVHNPAPKIGKDNGYRCSVCGTTKLR